MSCRWPDKQRHDTKAAAAGAIGALWRDGKGNPDLSAYPCGDHWHVGHSGKRLAKRIHRALNHTRPKASNRRRNR